MRIYLFVGLTILAPVTFASSGHPAVSQEFAADLVVIDADDERATGRVNVQNGKVRIETPEASGGYFLLEGDRHYFVKPEHRTYMEARQSSVVAQIFVPLAIDTPCGRLQAMATLSGAARDGAEWACHRIRDEDLAGRGTVLFRATSPQRVDYSIWIDKEFGFPLRVRGSDGWFYYLENIEAGAQPAGLFKLPSGYAKFDPQKLIELIKKSDVWVEPPQ